MATGCIDGRPARVYIPFEIRNNTPPVINFPKMDFSLYTSETLDVIIPSPYDKEGNSELEITAQFLNGTDMPYFAIYDQVNTIITVDPFSDADYGVYYFNVTVREVDAPLYFSEYTIKVQILAVGTNTAIQEIDGAPY